MSSLAPDAEPAFDSVERLEVRGRVYQAWQEAVERRLVCDELQVAALAVAHFPSIRVSTHKEEVEPVYCDNGTVVAVIVREWEHVSGSVEIAAARLLDDLDDIVKLRVMIRNQTPFVPYREVDARTRCHFLWSLRTPFSACRTAGSSLCSSRLSAGVDWQRGAGMSEPGQCWLASRTHGRRCCRRPSSSTTIRRLLRRVRVACSMARRSTRFSRLRIMTLTDDEKREMRQSDDRAREILERTENLPEEQFMKLHGVLRGLHPVS